MKTINVFAIYKKKVDELAEKYYPALRISDPLIWNEDFFERIGMSALALISCLAGIFLVQLHPLFIEKDTIATKMDADGALWIGLLLLFFLWVFLGQMAWNTQIVGRRKFIRKNFSGFFKYREWAIIMMICLVDRIFIVISWILLGEIVFYWNHAYFFTPNLFLFLGIVLIFSYFDILTIEEIMIKFGEIRDKIMKSKTTAYILLTTVLCGITIMFTLIYFKEYHLENLPRVQEKLSILKDMVSIFWGLVFIAFKILIIPFLLYTYIFTILRLKKAYFDKAAAPQNLKTTKAKLYTRDNLN